MVPSHSVSDTSSMVAAEQDPWVFLHKREVLALERWVALSTHLGPGHPPSYPLGGDILAHSCPTKASAPAMCVHHKWDPGQLGQLGCSHHWQGRPLARRWEA